VFFCTIERRFPSFYRSFGMCTKTRFETLGGVLFGADARIFPCGL
jgi:hypothetical protein